MTPEKIYCPVDGCTRLIRKDSKTGVCRDHVHTRPHCHCAQCRGERPRYRIATTAEVRDRDDELLRRRG